MLKMLTTYFASAALCLSLATAPAYADSKDTEKFIGAAALVALLGLAVHEANKKSDKKEVKKKNPEPNRHANNGRKRKSLPLSCLMQYQVKAGKKQAFSAPCLKDNYRFVRQMPNQCKQTLWTNKGTREVYNPKCLRNYGYEARNYYH